jgi:hypothetical protein
VTHSEVLEETSVEKPNERYRDLLTQYFPSDSWEVNEAQVLKNSDFVLLLKTLERLDDGRRLKLSPCTLVLLHRSNSETNDSAASALILRAPEGAILEFDRPFDWKTGGIGKLESGILRGQVTIESHGELGDEGELFVRTGDVQLNDERIWAPNQVDLQWGEHRVVGRDMTIRFFAKDQSQSHLIRNEVTSRIQSLEMVQVDQLRFMATSPLFPAIGKPSPSQPDPAAPDSTPTSTIDVTCSGRLLIDMLGRIATLEEQVQIVHPLPDGRFDRLDCDVATLHFLRRHHLGPVANSDTSDNSSKLPDFEVIHVTAMGSPAQLDLPSYNMEARGRRLEYHLRDRRLLMTDPQECYARYGPHVIRSPRVDVRYPSIENLLVDAEGPGRYDRTPEKKEDPPMQVRWQGALRVQPDGDRHLLSLIGGARLEAIQLGFLAADELQLWARRTTQDRNSSGEPSGATPATNDQWIPDRMRAAGAVSFDSPRLGGRTELLQIWLGNITEPNSPGAAVGELTLNQPARPAMGKLLGPSGNHFMLQGDQINAQLMSMDQQISLEKATVRGNVQFEETIPANAPQEPFVMKGQTLQLENASRETGVAAIYGSPATVSARGALLEATEIHLDRSSNHIWINVPGSVAVPLPARIAAEFARPRATATVTWQGRMDFDGQTISCFRNIEIRSPAQLVQAQSLQAALTEPLDLANPQIKAKDLALGQLQLAGNVWMENNSFDDTGLASVDRALMRELMIDQVTGKIAGVGPGSVSSVRRGQVPAPGNSPNDQGMTYLQVDFRDGIDGNIKDRELSFVGSVKGIYGPVDAWNHVLDVGAELVPGSPNVRMQCQRLTISQMAPGEIRTTPLEFVATGETTVEGKSFTAKADRISYDQGKDLLVVEGNDRNPAQLWRQATPGGPRQRLEYRTFMFWPQSNRISGQAISGDFFGPAP